MTVTLIVTLICIYRTEILIVVTCVCANALEYTHSQECICSNTGKCIGVHTFTESIYAHSSLALSCTCKHTYICTHTGSCKHMQTHTFAYVHIHTHEMFVLIYHIFMYDVYLDWFFVSGFNTIDFC